MPRLHIFFALILTIALGLFSRRYPVGLYLWDKSLGDALYALAVYLAILLLLPKLRPLPAFLLSTAICLAIETFKFTGLPAQWSDHFISRLILGTTPSLHNVLCYCTATVIAAVAHSFLLRPARARP